LYYNHNLLDLATPFGKYFFGVGGAPGSRGRGGGTGRHREAPGSTGEHREAGGEK